jgi:phage internal scaffolding protein
MFVRSMFNYDRDEASNASAIICDEPTLAQQHFKEQCDINRIVKQYAATGEVPGNARMPLPEDFVGVTDYHSAMNAVRRGEEAFAALPAFTRDRFKNDPALFVDFCLDPQNRAEAEKLGLVISRQVRENVPVSPTPKGVPEGDAQ